VDHQPITYHRCNECRRPVSMYAFGRSALKQAEKMSGITGREFLPRCLE
jgi:hypothetical protein